jgi:RNA 3'-terminal phosphate cyclase (ATP)
MLALSVLPLACFADSPIRARIEGGVFQDFAPVPHHLREVLAPLLRRMGVEIDVRVVRPGYVPGGPGILQITVTPTERGLIGLTLVDPGQVRHVQALPSQAVSPNAASASG